MKYVIKNELNDLIEWIYWIEWMNIWMIEVKYIWMKELNSMKTEWKYDIVSMYLLFIIFIEYYILFNVPNQRPHLEETGGSKISRLLRTSFMDDP